MGNLFDQDGMSYPLVLVIRHDPNRVSLNRMEVHWRTQRARKEAIAVAATVAYREAGEPVWDVPVEVDAVVRRAHRMDETNLRGALKAVEDVLFKQRVPARKGVPASRRRAITPDDGPEWVTWGGLEQEIDKRWDGCEEIVLTIWPREVLARREAAVAEVLHAAVRLAVWIGELQAGRRGLSDLVFSLNEVHAAVENAKRLGWSVE